MAEFRFGLSGHHPADYRMESDPEESSPERKKFKKELVIIIPDGFVLKEEDLRIALQSIIGSYKPGDSIDDLRAAGLTYSGQREFPTPIYILANEIVGTESRNGWGGLVEGVGQPDKHAKPQSIEVFLEHGQKILAMEQDERSAILDGIELARHQRKFFVDSDGRHRMLMLKALTQLGCDVSISGMKVTELV